MCISPKSDELFENYRWRLRELQSLEAELKKVRIDINDGLPSRYTVDPECEARLKSEYSSKKSELIQIDKLIESIPETKRMLPCKLYLRLHYLSGYSLTDTAGEMGISLSTLRRIRKRCDDYFDHQVL